jgi:hypothetical protein
MTTFIRLLADKRKEFNLLTSCTSLRIGRNDERLFQVAPESFLAIPGAPFAYWASHDCLQTFRNFPAFQNPRRLALRTNGTTNDGRWIRTWWEVDGAQSTGSRIWAPHAKGGAFSPFYADLYLVIDWDVLGNTYPGYVGTFHRPDVRPASAQYFFLPGLTWSRRNSTGLSFRVLPTAAIFGDKGPGIFFKPFDAQECLSVAAIVNSSAFVYLVSLQLGTFELAQSYEAGLIQQTPFPDFSSSQREALAILARRAWSLKRTLDTIEETSHAFMLPAALRPRLGDYKPASINDELDRIQTAIDAISFDLYNFSEADRIAAQTSNDAESEGDEETGEDDEGDDEESAAPIDQTASVLSWAVGVAFGRFDWRLATGEREASAQPEPFDPLPRKSPGMLPDGAAPFHAHAGILVDDQGHSHDLARLIEEVLVRIEMPIPEYVRHWLRRDFFAFHLQRYSKSRRKAPIYLPLATTSGSYTLWVDYSILGSQTLYTAINDFIEPKLKQVGGNATALRNRGTARTSDEEKQFESLQAFELELIELRDTLLKLANTYKPNHDDGVQISAAPLWQLFRNKSWQKVLKETWTSLHKGDYDWAHLAMNYWPERVREKCKSDKSLAIAHGLEDLYLEPEAKPKKARGKKKAGGDA